MSAAVQIGKVKWFRAERGYGFIEREYDVDVFVHASELPPGTELNQGDLVTFTLGNGPKGPKAVNVRKL